jgi:hypothetical protein
MIQGKAFLFLGLVLIPLAGASAFAGLSYQCKATRWNGNTGRGRICGEFRLSKESTGSNHEVVLEDCNLKAYGGSAFSGFMGGSVMTVYLGTRVSKLVGTVTGENLRDMTGITINPNDAPSKIELSLFPGSPRYRKYSYSLSCTKN